MEEYVIPSIPTNQVVGVDGYCEVFGIPII